MKKDEILNSATRKEKKKCYTSPKIEAIASVRKVTKGGGLAYQDGAGTYSEHPSDPG